MNGVEDSGQRTYSAPRRTASRVIATWVVKMRRASRGFHLSSWAMLPCTRPTRSGVPSRVSDPSAMRRLPQPPTAASTMTAAAIASDPLAAGRKQRDRDGGIDERHQRGDAVHAKHARQLRDGQHLHLAVAERHPRKAAEQVAAGELRATHAAGVSHSAAMPARLRRRLTITAVSAGYSARYAESSAIARSATGAASPPNVRTTSPVQYSVPTK